MLHVIEYAIYAQLLESLALGSTVPKLQFKGRFFPSQMPLRSYPNTSSNTN